MFKATPVLLKTLRRLPLNTKQAKKDYYKGNSVGNMGSIDQFGRFKVEWDKVRTYVYPEGGAKVRRFVRRSLDLTSRTCERMGENGGFGIEIRADMI